MIPKIIHYCWFGNGPMDDKTLGFINTWKIHMPEYKFILWNEENFDVETNQFASEAYRSKKYAYVSDYVRLYALYHFGGIYFDTDVEARKSFNELLIYNAFIGFEGNKLLGTGVIGAEKKHPWIEVLLKDYNKKRFIGEDGSYNTIPNSVLVSKIMMNEYNWKTEDVHQLLKQGVRVFNSEYFSAKNCKTGEIYANHKTFSVHHFG